MTLVAVPCQGDRRCWEPVPRFLTSWEENPGGWSTLLHRVPGGIELHFLTARPWWERAFSWLSSLTFVTSLVCPGNSFPNMPSHWTFYLKSAFKAANMRYLLTGVLIEIHVNRPKEMQGCKTVPSGNINQQSFKLLDTFLPIETQKETCNKTTIRQDKRNFFFLSYSSLIPSLPWPWFLTTENLAIVYTPIIYNLTDQPLCLPSLLSVMPANWGQSEGKCGSCTEEEVGVDAKSPRIGGCHFSFSPFDELSMDYLKGSFPLHMVFDKALGKANILAQGSHTRKPALDTIHLTNSLADELCF